MDIESYNKTLKDYFKSTKKIIIPFYQRDIIWENEKINEVWEEITENFDNNEIYWGSIFIKENNNEKEIIEGQQRNIFFYVLLKNLFNLFNESKKKFPESRRNDKNIKELNEIEEKFKNIKLYSKEEEINVNGREWKKISKISNQISKNIDEWRKNKESQDELDLLFFILDKSYFTMNRILSDEIINDVFKTINSKQKNLSVWDLIRNEIYKKNKNKIYLKKIDENFKKISKNFSQRTMELILVSIYLVEKNIPLENKQIFKKYSEEIKNNEDFIEKININIEKIVNFLEMEKNDYINTKVKWIYFLTEKFNFFQIKKFIFFEIMSGEINKEKSKIIEKMFFMFLISIHLFGELPSNFEVIFKSNDFWININKFIKNEDKIKTLIKKHNPNEIKYKESKYYEKINKNKEWSYLYTYLKINFDLERKSDLFSYYEKFAGEKYSIEHIIDKSIETDLIENKDQIGNLIIYEKRKNTKLPKEIKEKRKILLSWSKENIINEIYFEELNNLYKTDDEKEILKSINLRTEEIINFISKKIEFIIKEILNIN